ncbi:hypothetical protein [Amycolatopsis magusensis]|uniref:Uncharacterized protein n=1 Tax=Amycolatopsis magusensis TaxID=882444 RepID=A0ABS4PY93_9PSEU|nr:hypothetical protein [Amycolatopsis magusensis]MBP2183818.1 hypothetical protein [Amycolatopsis magusensis]
MRIYRMDPPGDCHWVTPVDPADNDRLEYDSAPLAEQWSPIEMQLVDGKGYQRMTSFPWHLNRLLMLRDDAIGALGPVLADYGELLPLDCPGMELNVFRNLVTADVLDEENSAIKYFEPEHELWEVNSYAFRADRLDGLMIFRTTSWPDGPLLFTDPMIDEFERTGLGHLDFFALWDPEHGPYQRAAEGELIEQDRRI